jgi:hypothetical protein
MYTVDTVCELLFGVDLEAIESLDDDTRAQALDAVVRATRALNRQASDTLMAELADLNRAMGETTEGS